MRRQKRQALARTSSLVDAWSAWTRLGWLRWPAAYVAIVALAALVGWRTVGVGNATFIAGALVILLSVGFIGAGGETRFRLIRNMMGVPIGTEKLDPSKRQHEISTGVKVFLLGLALWAPLIVIAWRS